MDTKFKTFKYTKEGMLYVPGEQNEFVMSEELKEYISYKIRMADVMLSSIKNSKIENIKSEIGVYEGIIGVLTDLLKKL